MFLGVALQVWRLVPLSFGLAGGKKLTILAQPAKPWAGGITAGVPAHLRDLLSALGNLLMMHIQAVR